MDQDYSDTSEAMTAIDNLTDQYREQYVQSLKGVLQEMQEPRLHFFTDIKARTFELSESIAKSLGNQPKVKSEFKAEDVDSKRPIRMTETAVIAKLKKDVEALLSTLATTKSRFESAHVKFGDELLEDMEVIDWSQDRAKINERFKKVQEERNKAEIRYEKKLAGFKTTYQQWKQRNELEK